MSEKSLAREIARLDAALKRIVEIRSPPAPAGRYGGIAGKMSDVAEAALTDAPRDSVVVPREALDAQHALGYRDAHIEIRGQGKVVVPMEKLREMQEYIDGNLVPVGNQIAVVNQLHARTALLDWLAALLKETGCSTVEE